MATDTSTWTLAQISSGFRTTVEVSKKVRHAAQPLLKARQFVRAIDAFGKNRGETVDIYRVPNTAEVESTTAIPDGDPIPTTTIGTSRRSVTVNQYGKALPFTGMVESLAEVDVENEVILKSLRNHMAKSLDTLVINALETSDLCFIPTGASSYVWDVDGTPSTAATSNITVFHLKEIVDAMMSGTLTDSDGTTHTAMRPVPFFTDDYYMALVSVKFLRGLYDDSDFEHVSRYANAEGYYQGEIGRMPFYHTRFVLSNHTAAISNGVGTNSVLGEAIIFGEEPVVEAVVTPEEIREKIPGNFGLDKALAWYYLGGFGRVWDYSSDSEEHIVRVTSS